VKRVWIAIVACIALAGVIGWHMAKPSDEPVYQGKRLSSWLKGLATSFLVRDSSHIFGRPDFVTVHLEAPPVGSRPNSVAANQEAGAAVRQAGTNGIPTLLRLLRARDSALKNRVMALVQSQRFVGIHHTPSEYWNYAAAFGFEQLGSEGRSAVPDLITMAKGSISASSQRYAITSLGSIGPAATQAIPALQVLLTNADRRVSATAQFALLQIDPEFAAKVRKALDEFDPEAGARASIPNAP
jgi:hypothetical protein